MAKGERDEQWRFDPATDTPQTNQSVLPHAMTNHILLRITLIMITLFALSVTACQKAKDGEVGPQGATGATGATGPQGPKGDPGSANVIYSTWISTPFTGSGSSYTGNVTAPKITQDVLDKADIRVYWNEGGRVLSLPYAEVVGTTAYTVHQRFYVGRIELKASYALGTQQFRYVIIPGGVASGRIGSDGLDRSNYQAVKAYYNIPD